MKNFTEKAKERLAEVEHKVNKQLSKERKAKSEIVKSEARIEKAKEDFKAKKEDMREVQEAKLAAQGKIHSKPGSSIKPPHEVEGQNAIEYMKYVNQSQESYKYYHKTPYNPREWHNPKKEKNDVEDGEEAEGDKDVKKSKS